MNPVTVSSTSKVLVKINGKHRQLPAINVSKELVDLNDLTVNSLELFALFLL